MNRLWVRLSVINAAVMIIIGGMAGAYIRLVVRPGAQIEALNLPPETLRELEAIFVDLQQQTAYFPIISIIIVGVIAGLITSITLTAPLRKLEEAARQIGPRNLQQRASARGTREINAVSDAFNEMAERLERAERLRRNMIADVAHELRTPLTVLQGNLQAILDDVYPLDKEEIGRLFNQTQQLGRLVHDLHELAQADAHALQLDMQETDVAQLVQETAVSFRPLSDEKGIALRVELLGNLPTLTLDRARLQQALSNLLSNAIRYTPPNGLIVLQVEQVERHVALRVTDNGVGITSEQLPNVFDRFYRTDRARTREQGGTGLGLAIARAIVEAHQGTITAVSPGVGQGTTFTISLPIA